MHHCAICQARLEVARLTCPSCGVSLEGRFQLPRLARLSADEQRLAERVLLAGGNLKAVGQQLGISYPTLRKRLDALQSALRELQEGDRDTTNALLKAVENKEITAEEAARLMEELNGGA
ncbi:MAG: DUF2089 family protein [Pseudomonadales bacterium]